MRARVSSGATVASRLSGAFGLGALLIIASSTASTLRPVLAETGIISSFLQPRRLIISFETFSTSAAGRSILLITGIIVRSCSRAR